jgi:hypothetical protein
MRLALQTAMTMSLIWMPWHRTISIRNPWAFMQNGPEMLRYFADRTPVRLRAFADFPDYQPYAPGARPDGGRSPDNEAFCFEELGGPRASTPARWPIPCAEA